jgi:hypothetical protein
MTTGCIGEAPTRPDGLEGLRNSVFSPHGTPLFPGVGVLARTQAQLGRAQVLFVNPAVVRFDRSADCFAKRRCSPKQLRCLPGCCRQPPGCSQCLKLSGDMMLVPKISE